MRMRQPRGLRISYGCGPWRTFQPPKRGPESTPPWQTLYLGTQQILVDMQGIGAGEKRPCCYYTWYDSCKID